MNISVAVTTADGVSIPGASVSVNNGTPTLTDATGRVALASSGSSVSLSVVMTGYGSQDITLAVGSGGALTWDDPGSVVSGSGSNLTIQVPLGRLTPAPTVPWGTPVADLDYANSDIALRQSVVDGFKSPFNSAFTLPLQFTFTRPDDEYAFLYAGKARFHAATTRQLLGSQDGAQGWDAFNAGQPSVIEPVIQGHFTWVEWTSPDGQSNASRYLVALWRLRSTATLQAATRDAIVFYTPNTAFDPGGNLYFPKDSPPYRGNYPYGANQRGLSAAGGTGSPLPLAQRYVELGLRYLFNERFLAYDLLAAGRNALVIVPICPSGNWEEFGVLGGVQRLLLESILFERRANDDPAAGPLDTAPPRRARALIVQRVMGSYAPPPSLGRIVVAGTSGGGRPVKSLLQMASLASSASGQTARSWQDEVKNPYLADPTALNSSWRELWDFEISQQSVGAKAGWAQTLIAWQRAPGHYSGGVSDRIIRMYHADYTGWTANDLNLMLPALGGTNGQPTQRSSQNGGMAVELEGSTGTAVWFSRKFLEGNGPAPGWVSPTPGNVPDQPAFWTGHQHHVVSTICFAHAAGISGLQTASSQSP